MTSLSNHRSGLLAAVLLLPIAGAAAPFDAEILVDLRRLSDPQLSPDGREVAYVLRETDRENDKGATDLWVVAADGSGSPRRLTSDPAADSQPRWAADGKALCFLSKRGDHRQVWRLAGGEGAEPEAVTDLPLDVKAYALSPTGGHLVVSVDVYRDCPDLACTRERLDEGEARQDSALVFDELIVRHWDTWEDGRRATLFAIDLDGNEPPRALTAQLDAHVPPRPFGGPSAFAIAADGGSVFFAARAAAGSEKAWSTNLDIFQVPVDGSAAPKNLTTSLPGTENEPTPSPDGRRLAFS